MGPYALTDPANAGFANFPAPDLAEDGQYKRA